MTLFTFIDTRLVSYVTRIIKKKLVTLLASVDSTHFYYNNWCPQSISHLLWLLCECRCERGKGPGTFFIQRSSKGPFGIHRIGRVKGLRPLKFGSISFHLPTTFLKSTKFYYPCQSLIFGESSVSIQQDRKVPSSSNLSLK